MVTFTLLCRISQRKYKDLTLRWCCCAVGSCSPPARPPFPSSTTLTNSRHSIFHFPANVLANLHFILLSVFSPNFIGFSLLSFFSLLSSPFHYNLILPHQSRSALISSRGSRACLSHAPCPRLCFSHRGEVGMRLSLLSSQSLLVIVSVCACVWM